MVWLPGTDTIVMAGGKGDNQNLYLVEPGEVRQLTTTGDVVGFGFSATGRRLIWARGGKAPHQSLLWLYAYDLPSRTAKRLPLRVGFSSLKTDPGFALDSLPYVAFSPDGSRLVLPAMVKRSLKGEQEYYMACYSMNLDGSDLRLIRRGRRFLFPVWTRDSRQLVIWDLDEVRSVLRVYSVDGTGGKTLRITRTPFIE